MEQHWLQRQRDLQSGSLVSGSLNVGDLVTVTLNNRRSQADDVARGKLGNNNSGG